MKQYFIYITLVTILLSSCFNTKYMNKERDTVIEKAEQYKLDEDKYTLKVGDYLFIDVKSSNEEVNALYSQYLGQGVMGQQNNRNNLPISNFFVNDSGYLQLPTIGKLYLQGKTIVEVRQLITREFEKILVDPVVNVRLANFNVIFLGEVAKKGLVNYQKDEINVLEGIGIAGGVTDYGDKRKVRVFRETDSTMSMYKIDITDKNLITLKEFYLFPNDIVYVTPRRSKDALDFVRDYSIFVSIFTSTVTTALFIIEITKKK